VPTGLRSLGAPPETARRTTDAESSKTVFIERRFRCSWLPEVPGEYPASLDKKCAGFKEADRAGDRRRFPFAQKSADQETKSKSRYSERPAGIALDLGSLGNSLPQRKLLPGDTNPLGVAAGRLLKSVDPNCPIDQCAHSGSSRTGMYSGRYLRRAATKSISKLPMGSNPITAIYSGDAESEKGASLPTISGELVRAGVLSDSLVYGLRARRQKRKLVNESPRAICSFFFPSYIGTNSYNSKSKQLQRALVTLRARI